jgi:predicted enzyme related to lactoylglutathione lyase
MTMKAKPVIYSVPSNDIKRSQTFYSKLLGVEVARSFTDQYESYNTPISDGGLDLTVNQRHTQHDTPMMYFAVDNLRDALAQAEKLGATTVWGPQEIAIDAKYLEQYSEIARRETPGAKPSTHMGSAAVLVDPGGSQFGLMELAEHTHGHFKYGKHMQKA